MHTQNNIIKAHIKSEEFMQTIISDYHVIPENLKKIKTFTGTNRFKLFLHEVNATSPYNNLLDNSMKNVPNLNCNSKCDLLMRVLPCLIFMFIQTFHKQFSFCFSLSYFSTCSTR